MGSWCSRMLAVSLWPNDHLPRAVLCHAEWQCGRINVRLFNSPIGDTRWACPIESVPVVTTLAGRAQLDQYGNLCGWRRGRDGERCAVFFSFRRGSGQRGQRLCGGLGQQHDPQRISGTRDYLLRTHFRLQQRPVRLQSHGVRLAASATALSVQATSCIGRVFGTGKARPSARRWLTTSSTTSHSSA